MADAQLRRVVRQLRKLAGSPDCDSLTDPHLLERFILMADDSAFERLVERHGPMVLKVCRHVLGHEQDAEDAFQVTFLVLARKARSVRKRASLAGWLHGVAYRTALAARRAAARRRKHERQAQPMTQTNPSAELAWGEVQAALDEAVQALPEKYRTPFLLCVLEGRSRADVATELGLNEGTISSRLDRARKRLQAALGRRGIALSAVLAGVVVAEGVKAAPVSAVVLEATVRAGVDLAAGKSLAGAAVSPHAISLFQAVMKSMFAAKCSMAFAVSLSIILLGAGVGLVTSQVLTAAGQHAEAKNELPRRAPRAAAAPIEEKRPQADLYGDLLPAGAIMRLGTERLRGGRPMVFSADSKVVFCAHGSNTLRLWDVASGRAVGLGKLEVAAVEAMVLSPDGKSFATGSADGICIWDLASDKEIRQIKSGRAANLVFSPDGKLIISGGSLDQTTVRVFELATGKERLSVRWHQRLVTQVVCADNGKSLLTACPGEGKICRTDLATGALLQTIEVEKELRAKGMAAHVHAIALSQDGQYAAFAGSRRQGGKPAVPWLALYNAATGVGICELSGHHNWIAMLAFSPDAKTLASGSHDKTIRLWDVATGAQRLVIDRPTDVLGYKLLFSPDSKTLAAVWGDSTIHLWNTATGKELHARESHEGEIGTIAFSPDGRWVATGSFYDQTMRIWELRNGRQQHVIRHPACVQSVAFLPDSKSVISGGGDSFLRLWDVASGRELRRFEVEGRQQVLTMCLTTDAKTLIAFTTGFTDAEDDIITTAWDAASGKRLFQHRQHLEFRFGHPYPSPDGKRFLMPGNSGDLVVRETGTWKELVRLKAVDQWRLGPGSAFSPNGKLLASASIRSRQDGPNNVDDDASIRIFDLATGKELLHVPWPEPIPRTVPRYPVPLAFSPDGKTLAMAVDSRSIHLFDVATGKETGSFRGVGAPVECLAFSADGRRLAAGLFNATALIWDLGKK